MNRRQHMVTARLARAFRSYGSLWGGNDSESAETARIAEDCREAGIPMGGDRLKAAPECIEWSEAEAA